MNNIATVTVIPSPLSLFQFSQTSRYDRFLKSSSSNLTSLRTTVITSGSAAQLVIERIRGVLLIGEVSITTRSPSASFTYQGLTVQPAIGAEHYSAIRDTIRMDRGEVCNTLSQLSC